jgi:hypothetical protein
MRLQRVQRHDAFPTIYGGGRMPVDKPLAIAIVTDDDRSDPSIARATELGLERGARVVLYDVSATGSIFENPLPTEWSSEDQDRALPPMLTADQLETAGQGSLARRVRALVEAGLEAYGWLPDRGDAASLAEYADAQDASVIIALDGVDPSAADLEKAGSVPVEVAQHD